MQIEAKRLSLLVFSTYGFYSSLACHNYKCFTIIIYDHNDSGQYYKTTIVVKASRLALTSLS
jgi:hypothetical protein